MKMLGLLTATTRARAIALWSILLLPITSTAEDIDLFLGPPSTASSSPNVLLIFDNSRNWNTVFTSWKQALVTVFGVLPDDGINVGIMMFTPSDGGAANSGGYVRAAIRPMTDDDADGDGTKTLYGNMINALVNSGNQSDGESNGKISNTMAEAYAYFSGDTARAGDGRDKTDYDGNNYSRQGCCADARKIWALDDNALPSNNRGNYLSPVDDEVCAGNYIIFISNGPTQDNSSINEASLDYLAEQRVDGAPDMLDLTALSTQVPGSSPSQAAGNWADEWAQFMKQESDLAVTTYTVDINTRPNNGQGPNMTLLLRSMADQGGGEYYDLRGDSFDASGLVGALENILSRILAKNSVFASVALPASAGTSSTFLNQVFVGLFRPDADAKPRWPGNLKQYKLGFDPDDGKLKVVDQDDDPIAETDQDAQNIILECARSFWTPDVIGRQAYWGFLGSEGGCGEGGASSAAYDTPDGPNVEKGGHAYILRATDPDDRTVYTCSSTWADCRDDVDVLTDLSTNPTFTDLDVPEGDRNEYVNWLVGYDFDDANENTETDDMRPYIHGDVVHSRPVALDYNLDPNNPDVVVFYGGNDGMLRAVNGNRSGSGAGSEYWAFLPPEFFPNVKILRDNTEVVKFPSSGLNAGEGVAKPYAMDGPLAIYTNDSDDDGDYDDVYLYAGMHRGGRAVYALEVSEIDAKPDLKWKVGCPNLDNDTDCTAGMSAIGQTWSPFALTTAAGYDDGDTPLIIMGGGYDDCEDVDQGSTGSNHDCEFDGGGDDDKGNAIYVLDATDGTLQATLGTERPVPGAVTVVPYVDEAEDYENLIKYAYAVDTGGNVYRISGGTQDDPAPILDAAPGTWVITQIASLGCDDPVPGNPAACTNGNPSNRKFLFGPDVVRQPETQNYVILVASGDREKPLTDYGSAYQVQNYFYSIVDQPLTEDWLDDGTDNTCDNSDYICMDGLTDLGLDGLSGLAEGLSLSRWGWKYALGSHEQGVSGALTIADNVSFSTHIPATYDAGACEGNLGEATTYTINYLNGDGIATEIIGGGLVPTPVAGKVIIPGVDNPVPFCIGCGGENSPIGGTEVFGTVSWSQPKNRVYWNIKQ